MSSEGWILGFKKALTIVDHKPVIITLSIPPNARTNINRKLNMLDQMFAKHRCDCCLVTEIVDQETGEKHFKAMSISPPSGAKPIIYTVGKMIIADRYDTADWNICSHGIHFFMSFARALTYRAPFRDNRFQVWYDSGGMRFYGETFGEVFHGLFIEYNPNGTIAKELMVRRNIIQHCYTLDWRSRTVVKRRETDNEGKNIYVVIPFLRKLTNERWYLTRKPL